MAINAKEKDRSLQLPLMPARTEANLSPAPSPAFRRHGVGVRKSNQRYLCGFLRLPLFFQLSCVHARMYCFISSLSTQAHPSGGILWWSYEPSNSLLSLLTLVSLERVVTNLSICCFQFYSSYFFTGTITLYLIPLPQSLSPSHTVHPHTHTLSSTFRALSSLRDSFLAEVTPKSAQR